MKKIIISALLAVTVLSLSGCFQKKDIQTTTTQDALTDTNITEEGTKQESYEYSNKEKEFSVQVPSAWTFKENVFGSLVMFFSAQKEGDNVRENLGIVAQKLEGDVQLNSYYELTRANLESVIPEFELINENIQLENNKITFSYKGTQEGNILQRQQTLFLQGTSVYVFTYTAIEDTFQGLLSEANTIIDSFSIQ